MLGERIEELRLPEPLVRLVRRAPRETWIDRSKNWCIEWIGYPIRVEYFREYFVTYWKKGIANHRRFGMDLEGVLKFIGELIEEGIC